MKRVFNDQNLEIISSVTVITMSFHSGRQKRSIPGNPIFQIIISFSISYHIKQPILQIRVESSYYLTRSREKGMELIWITQSLALHYVKRDCV